MIITNEITINGKSFIKTYSDSGMKIEREGVKYSEAIDPSEFGRVYTETSEPIKMIDAGFIEVIEKAKAYDILMGVSE
jgi:hypothetical protein